MVPANPDILDGVDDLMQLSYLNEPSVLYNIQCRYKQDMIYVSISMFLFWMFYILVSASNVLLSPDGFMGITLCFLDKSWPCFGCYKSL